MLGMVSDLTCVGRSGPHGNEKVSLGSGKNCGTLLPIETDKLKSNAASVFRSAKLEAPVTGTLPQELPWQSPKKGRLQIPTSITTKVSNQKPEYMS